MDILRKELNDMYAAQELGDETLDDGVVEACCRLAESMTAVDGACRVITDASCDTAYIFYGDFGRFLGLDNGALLSRKLDSSDEDELYNRLLPRDLADKRMLEYEYFRHIHKLSGRDKLKSVAMSRFRMADSAGKYVWVDNSTRIMVLSPAGKFWLILCTYSLSPSQLPQIGISPTFLDNSTGCVSPVAIEDTRANLLTGREKEILKLIGSGLLSKEIASKLGISINTVNRHRQNILEKLDVGTSIEALNAAQSMELL